MKDEEIKKLLDKVVDMVMEKNSAELGKAEQDSPAIVKVFANGAGDIKIKHIPSKDFYKESQGAFQEIDLKNKL
jgi:hypothetical protein